MSGWQPIENMRERIARAIGRGLDVDDPLVGDVVEERDLFAAAAAVLAAMREPTLEMGDKARDMTGAGYSYSPDPIHPLGHLQIGLIWRTMIDAAASATGAGR